jgi:hypothetical protein
MKSNLVRLSGIWNLGLAAAMIYPPLLGLSLKPVWAWLIAAFLVYTASTLILGAGNVPRYAPIILYEGLLRFAAAALLIPAGLLFGYGPLVAAVGAIDAIWGLTYFLIVPRQTGKPIAQLLLGDTV